MERKLSGADSGAFLIAKGSPFGTAGGNPLMLDMRGLMPVGQDATQIEFDTLLDVLDEASRDWTEREVPFWAFVALPEEDFPDME